MLRALPPGAGFCCLHVVDAGGGLRVARERRPGRCLEGLHPMQVIASVIAQSLMEKVTADIWMQERVHLPELWLGKLLRLLLLPRTLHVVLCIDPTSEKESDHMASRIKPGKPNIDSVATRRTRKSHHPKWVAFRRLISARKPVQELCHIFIFH